MGDFVTDSRHLLNPAEFARERLGTPLDARQAEVLGVAGNRVLLNCTRQWGKSTITAAMAVHRAFFVQKSLIVVVSPTARQSAEFLRKAADFVKVLGIDPRGDGDNAISLLFPNGSRIVGLPGTEGTVRGFSKVSLMIIDEAARVADELYFAVQPMTAVGDGDLWLMSTPFGRRGFYWKEWNRPDRWMRVSVPATECSRLSAKHLEHVRGSMPDNWFRQEYMCEFGDDEKCLFSQESLDRAVRKDVAVLDFQFHWSGPGSEWFVAVDLGQKQDYTAIVAVERMVRVLEQRNPVTFAWRTETVYQVRHLERMQLGTSYVDVVERVRERL